MAAASNPDALKQACHNSSTGVSKMKEKLAVI